MFYASWLPDFMTSLLLYNKVHNLIEFLQKYHHWFLFLLLEIVSLVLLFQFNSYQGSVWFTSANYVSGKVYETDAAIRQFFSLTRINDELTLRNVYLEKQVEQLSERLLKVTDDSLQATAEQKRVMANFRVIPAHVISNSIDKQDNLITLDRGAADGIRPDMGVVSGTGIVGIVYQVTDHYSVVIPLLSSRSNTSCKIDKRGYFGRLSWDGKSSRIAYLEDIPRHAHFRLYDKVVTSGYSSVFPPGFMVGKILHVYESKDGLSFRAQVLLSTDFGRLRNVCVIDDNTIRERLEIMRAAEDSLRLKKD